MDQFLAAVEVRRRPDLIGRPVVVGGDGDPTRPRQVVATASYEARAHGVRSGMPLRRAATLCPEAVFLPSDRPAYDAASDEVMASLRASGHPVEVLGWDEAFVGVAAGDPVEAAHDLKRAVLDATGLSCAVGIGQTRLQAKTATGRAKPGGVATLTTAEWLDDMGDRPVAALWGIGPRLTTRLSALGIVTVRDLADADLTAMVTTFGPTIGPSLKASGLGGIPSPLDPTPHVARSRSREVTFTTDVSDRDELVGHLEQLAHEVTGSVVAEGRVVTHVAVKVRTATFFTRTKIAKLPAPTTEPDDVARQALVLLDRFDLWSPVRLLGVRVVLAEP